jgi:hypothetical protein
MCEMTTSEPYTDAQATDEAVLLLVRRLHRLYPREHASLLASFPEGVRQALMFADQRADLLRAEDARAGIERMYVDRFAELDDDDE